MSSREQRVWPSVIFTPRMRTFSTIAKLVYLYLWSCEHRNTEGLFKCPPPYIAADLGLSVEAIIDALEELKEVASYDALTEIVLLKNALPVMQLKAGDKRIAGAIKQLEKLPSTQLLGELLEIADECAPDFADAMREQFPHLPWGASKPHSSPIDGTEQEQSYEQERDYEESMSASQSASTRQMTRQQW